MKKFLAISIALFLVLGCTSHSKHHHKKMVIVSHLDNEHQNKAIVIVAYKPKSSRKCWTHGNHWHCKR